jgi:hypothetical protein
MLAGISPDEPRAVERHSGSSLSLGPGGPLMPLCSDLWIVPLLNSGALGLTRGPAHCPLRVYDPSFIVLGLAQF